MLARIVGFFFFPTSVMEGSYRGTADGSARTLVDAGSIVTARYIIIQIVSWFLPDLCCRVDYQISKPRKT